MISHTAIVLLIIQIIIAIGAPIILLIYGIKKFRISWKPILVGLLIFVVFSQILEAILHQYVLVANPTTAKLLTNPWLYALYGSLAAGVFEEVGRYIGLRYMLRKFRRWKDAVAYGIGHGGVEAIILGGLSAISVLVMALMINSGAFDTIMQPNDQGGMQLIKQQLLDTPAYAFLLGGLERVFALTIQIALSLLVLYGIMIKKKIFLLYAIAAHAIVDFLPALSQQADFNLFLIEGYILIMAIISFMFIIKSKGLFEKLNTEANE